MMDNDSIEHNDNVMTNDDDDNGEQPKIMKMLSENKLKRLNILTYINDKKEILFTKKAYKSEKECIWREIFDMMRDSGMVSAEKDWRYVRDVSFSNWRKRAQKRLKYLSSNGYCMNMDECEFLISDILGQTPDKSMIRKLQQNNRQQQQQQQRQQQLKNNKQQLKTILTNGATNGIDNDDDDDNEEIDNEDDDNDVDDDNMNEDNIINGHCLNEDTEDEYMIDSDEEDTDYLMNEMLFIPKIVINDQPTMMNNRVITNNHDAKKSNGMIRTNQSNFNGKNQQIIFTSNNHNTNMINGNSKTLMMNNNSTNTAKMKPMINNNHHNNNQNQSIINHIDMINDNDDGDHHNQYEYQNEQRLLELEIENKILKNRYMKLKILELEKQLGFDHCEYVQELLLSSTTSSSTSTMTTPNRQLSSTSKTS